MASIWPLMEASHVPGRFWDHVLLKVPTTSCKFLVSFVMKFVFVILCDKLTLNHAKVTFFQEGFFVRWWLSDLFTKLLHTKMCGDCFVTKKTVHIAWNKQLMYVTYWIEKQVSDCIWRCLIVHVEEQVLALKSGTQPKHKWTFCAL